MSNSSPRRESIAVCRVCGTASLSIIRESQIRETLGAHDFKVTDAGYGITGQVKQCSVCSFRQCDDMGEVLAYYEEMDDTGYEGTRDARLLQARGFLADIARDRTHGRLLDIGAGSGILVEEAIKQGFAAEGVEPSRWLAAQAAERKLPVAPGVLPHPDIRGSFDVVTLIDVIEHVTAPLELLIQMRTAMADDGIGVIVTPDVSSWAPRLLGWKWWHYRIAHIGYFDRRTLTCLVERAGLKPKRWSRPTWHLPADYLFKRLASYLPSTLQPPTPGLLSRITVALNLFDSMLLVVTKG